MVEPSHPLIFYVLANCAVLVGSIVQASTGIGFAMIVAPILALITLDFVPGPVIVINLFLSLLMLRDGRSKIVGHEVIILLPSITCGTVVAVAFLISIPNQIFSIVFALLILIAIAISLLAKAASLSVLTLSLGGFFARVMGTTAGISGPPLAVLYQRHRRYIKPVRPSHWYLLLHTSHH